MTDGTLGAAVADWYVRNARPLAWRAPGTTAWGVLLSEVMSQQTPVSRVEPQWREWLDRWPTPTDLAAASRAEVIRAWGNLGYPRRALRLHECATAIRDVHHGDVPSDIQQLLSLPGIGTYTAAAIACFHFGQPVPVVDTNVRRVIARAIQGTKLAGPPRKADAEVVRKLLPAQPAQACLVSVGLMELGALVCTARRAQCGRCPLAERWCRWHHLGCPEPSAHDAERARTRVQKYAGTDRQARGAILRHIRHAAHPVDQSALDIVWPLAPQRDRALASLLDDGLVVQTGGQLTLPD